MPFDGVVGVIGAGASGLYAADILKTKGVAVRVFEASDRIGGRIRSIRIFDDAPVKTDFPVELGAERIIGTDSLWANMISQLVVPANEISSVATEHFLLDNKLFDGATLATDSDFVAAKAFFDNIVNYSGTNISVEEAIAAAGVSPRMNAILNALIGNRAGTSNDRVSITSLKESLGLTSRNSNQLLLRSNPMQDALTSRFSAIVQQVELNTAIEYIDFSGERIVLTGSSNGTAFTAEVDKVIIAVPVSILKAGDIQFTPALPAAKTSSLAGIGMDACVRVVLDFKQNFWSKNASCLYGGVTGSEFFNSGVTRSEYNKTLSLTVNGPKAEMLSQQGPESIPAILEELDTFFGGKATANIRRNDDQTLIYEWMDWYKAPYIKGGWSYIKPGASQEARVTLAEQVNNQLYFAGEATDIAGDAGTINGALHSGERAAQEVVDSILNG